MKISDISGLITICYYSVIILINILIYFGFPPELKDIFILRWNNPWGVITSLFVHEQYQHLIDSISVITIYLVIFLVIIYMRKFLNYRYTMNDEFLIFCFMPFFSAVISYLAFILYYPFSNLRGASGITYAMVGLIYGISIWNVLRELQRNGSIRSSIRGRLIDNRSYIYYLIINIFFVMYLTYSIFIIKQEFFNIQPGVSVFAHSTSFLISFIITPILNRRSIT